MAKVIINSPGDRKDERWTSSCPEAPKVLAPTRVQKMIHNSNIHILCNDHFEKSESEPHSCEVVRLRLFPTELTSICLAFNS